MYKDLAKDSFLISWLFKQAPLVFKSLVLAMLISRTDLLYKASILFATLSIIAKFAPKISNSLDYGIGFFIAYRALVGQVL
jgi:hypothetical protein